MGLRTNRYSWWVHWKELADYFLPPVQVADHSEPNVSWFADQPIYPRFTGCTYAPTLPPALFRQILPNQPLVPPPGSAISTRPKPRLPVWLAEVERIMYPDLL